MIPAAKRYLYGFYSYLILLAGIIPSQLMRKFIYRNLFGAKLGEKVTFHRKVEIRSPHRLTIGDNTIIGDQTILDARAGLEIGKNVQISTGVWIWTLEHDPHDPYFRTKGGKVIINDYAWISCRAIILPEVTIGKGAVVAAGSVVTKDVQDYTIVGGVPAKIIGSRTNQLLYNLGFVVPFL